MLAALVMALPAAALAQSSGVEQTWQFEPLRAGYCIEFLIDSVTARRELPKGLIAVPAADAPSLHPAVAATVAERPDSFSALTPSQLCLFWSQTVNVDGRRIAEREDRVQAVGVWSILARPADSAGGAPVPAAVKLYASNWRAAGLGRAIQIDFERMEVAAGKVPVEDADGRLVPGADDRYQVRLGKTTVTWDGRPTGGSTTVAEPVSKEWRAAGLRRTTWTIHGSLQPEGSGPVVGALRVSGKDRLARSLQASPIRFVGPWYSGGTAQIVFSR